MTVEQMRGRSFRRGPRARRSFREHGMKGSEWRRGTGVDLISNGCAHPNGPRDGQHPEILSPAVVRKFIRRSQSVREEWPPPSGADEPDADGTGLRTDQK